MKEIFITIFNMFKKLNRDMEDIKKIQTQVLKMKTTMCKMKNTAGGIWKLSKVKQREKNT